MDGHQVSAASPERLRRLCSQSIEERFPGVVVWHGQWTGRWWAYIPGGGLGWLVEADHPGTLSGRIADTYRAVAVVVAR